MNKKKAFTLMELLVVVIVLGVLGAVAAPKLSRVLETRRTAEAEEMLSALRTEQEKRCILGKNYTADAAKVPVVAAAARSKSYTYALKETGAEASRGEYTLKMPSYKDGRMCCEGDGCAKLNKNYIACNAIPADDECKAQDMPCTDCSCTAYAAEHGCECSPSAATCCGSAHSEGDNGSQACECGSVGGKWHCDSDTGYSWVLNLTGSCAEKPGDEENTCSDGTTKQHRSYECVNGAWIAGAWDQNCKECDSSHKEGDLVRNESYSLSTGDISAVKTNLNLFEKVSAVGGASIVSAIPNATLTQVTLKPGLQISLSDALQYEISDCPPGQCGTSSKYWHCGSDTAYAWTQKTESNCTSQPSPKKRDCTVGKGTQTAKYTCQSGSWVLGEYQGDCEMCPASSKPASKTENCTTSDISCGLKANKVECNQSTGQWEESWGVCAAKCSNGQTTKDGSTCKVCKNGCWETTTCPSSGGGGGGGGGCGNAELTDGGGCDYVVDYLFRGPVGHWECGGGSSGAAADTAMKHFAAC